MRWVQLCGSLSILWHCLSLGLEWKLTFSSPVATAEFSKFAGILGYGLTQPYILPQALWLGGVGHSWFFGYCYSLAVVLVYRGFPGGARGTEPACQCRRHKRDSGLIPGLGISSGGGHGNSLQYAWRNPWTEEPSGLRSLGLHRGRHDWNYLTRMHWYMSLTLAVLFSHFPLFSIFSNLPTPMEFTVAPFHGKWVGETSIIYVGMTNQENLCI